MPSSETRTPFSLGAPRLGAQPLRTLNDVLPALYAETGLHHLPRVFTDVLARLVPGESHGVLAQDSARGQRWSHLRPAAAHHLSLVPVFFANLHEFAPTMHRRETGTGAALALSDFVDRAALERLALYTGYYRPLGLEDDLTISVRCGGTVICASVTRARRGFRHDERELLNALRPHLRQAWTNAEIFSRRPDDAAAATPPAGENHPAPLERQFGLSPREAEVLIWVAQGKTNGEVATILGIRPTTVRTHLERVFLKLGVETRLAAGLRAIAVLGWPHG